MELFQHYLSLSVKFKNICGGTKALGGSESGFKIFLFIPNLNGYGDPQITPSRSIVKILC